MGNATSMAELMAKHHSTLKSFKKGENIEGVITKLTPGEILIDIGAKTEAVVLEKDRALLRTLLSTLEVGNKVKAYVLNPESDQGNPVVSLRGFMDEKHWGVLEAYQKDKKELEVNVNELTKGGFLVTTLDGFAGFLPNSQAILNDNPASFVGKKIKVQVLEINRSLHKVIFSQKAAFGEEDFSKIASQIKAGEIVDAVVSNTTAFGIFVSVKNAGDKIALEGFIHLSELSWDKVESAESYYKTGEKIKAYVLGIDKEAKRINLSVKRLTKDPFEDAVSVFTIDKKVKAKISKINSLGITLELDGGIEGLIKKEKVPPTSKYATGDEIEATVSEVDNKRHRVILTPVLKEKPIGYR